MNRPLSLGLMSLLFAAPITAAGLGAHQHGVAQLDIAQEGQTLELAFHSPLNNLTGFEHQPRTEQQDQALEHAEALLQQGAALFLLPESAGCTLAAVELEQPFPATDHSQEKHAEHATDGDEHHNEHVAHEGEHHAAHEDEHRDQHEHHDHENSHADMAATWRFHCKQPQHLKRFETRLLEQFPALEHLKVQSFNERGQRSQELSAQQNLIELP